MTTALRIGCGVHIYACSFILYHYLFLFLLNRKLYVEVLNCARVNRHVFDVVNRKPLSIHRELISTSRESSKLIDTLRVCLGCYRLAALRWHQAYRGISDRCIRGIGNCAGKASRCCLGR